MSASSFTTTAGHQIVLDLAQAIHEAKQTLSDIDGRIGDGDHGINMNKGFTLCVEELQHSPGDLSHALDTLARILLSKIGGSMGPLYGMFFRAMAAACKNAPEIGGEQFGRMLLAGREAIQKISPAQRGDKTMMDVLVPAEVAYRETLCAGQSFTESLDAMVAAAIRGRDATWDMVAKLGRSSRLGERSRGVLDAGAVSCCLILETMATTIKTLLT